MFGFEAINNSQSVLISSGSKHLTFRERLSITVQNTKVVDRQAVGEVGFSTPITSAAPPSIFAKVASSRHGSMNMYCVLLGGPGNWTGFRVYAGAQGGSTLPKYVLDCAVCSYENITAAGNYGMALYNDGQELLFSHKSRLVKYSKFTKKWSLVVTSPSYTWYTLKPTDITIDPDDYIDISTLNRGVVLLNVYGRMFSSIVIYKNGRPTLELTMQSDSWQSSPKRVSDMNFCMPICKFPMSLYP